MEEWVYPSLLLVEHDEKSGYAARWATELVGSNAHSALALQLQGIVSSNHLMMAQPASSSVGPSSLDASMMSNASTPIVTPEKMPPVSQERKESPAPSPPSGQPQSPHLGYYGILNLLQHCPSVASTADPSAPPNSKTDVASPQVSSPPTPTKSHNLDHPVSSAAPVHLSSFLHQGKHAVTGTALRRHTNIELLVGAAAVEEPMSWIYGGRKPPKSKLTGHALRSHPVPHLVYKFWIADIQARGGKMELNFIVVHKGFELLMSEQDRLLPLLDAFRDWLVARAQAKYEEEMRCGGTISFHDQRRARDTSTRRPLAHIIGGFEPDVGTAGGQESNDDADGMPSGGGGDGISPQAQGNTSDDETPLEEDDTQSSGFIPEARTSTATFGHSSVSGASPMGSPQASQSAVEPSPSTSGEGQVAAQQALPPRPTFLDYLVHHVFEAILLRLTSAAKEFSTAGAKGMMEEVETQAGTALSKHRGDPWVSTRNLWPLFRPPCFACNVFSSTLKNFPDCAFVTTTLKALFTGQQLIITTTESGLDEANDFAVALAALLPFNLARVCLSSDVYRPSYECDILTFSKTFYSQYQVEEQRQFTADEQFVLSEDADLNAVHILVGSILNPTHSSDVALLQEAQERSGQDLRHSLVIKKANTIEALANPSDELELSDYPELVNFVAGLSSRLHKELRQVEYTRQYEVIAEAEARCNRAVLLHAAAARQYVACIKDRQEFLELHTDGQGSGPTSGDPMGSPGRSRGVVSPSPAAEETETPTGFFGALRNKLFKRGNKSSPQRPQTSPTSVKRHNATNVPPLHLSPGSGRSLQYGGPASMDSFSMSSAGSPREWIGAASAEQEDAILAAAERVGVSPKDHPVLMYLASTGHHKL